MHLWLKEERKIRGCRTCYRTRARDAYVCCANAVAQTVKIIHKNKHITIWLEICWCTHTLIHRCLILMRYKREFYFCHAFFNRELCIRVESLWKVSIQTITHNPRPINAWVTRSNLPFMPHPIDLCIVYFVSINN